MPGTWWDTPTPDAIEWSEHIGCGVVYRPYSAAPAEDGEVVRVTDAYVFVQYVGDRAPKATSPGDLTLLNPHDHKEA